MTEGERTHWWDAMTEVARAHWWDAAWVSLYLLGYPKSPRRIAAHAVAARVRLRRALGAR